MPRERLSSQLTFFMKWVFPPLWIGVFSLATLAVFVAARFGGDPRRPPVPPFVPWLMLGMLLGAGSLIYWTCVRLKRVEMDGHSLYVSNFLREVEVPVREIVDVRQLGWPHRRHVAVEFQRETDFGSEIVFITPMQWSGFGIDHPVVERIRSAAREDRRG